ncbi:MAG: hypothetical protein WAM14_23475 [Candidatus Nitrosopolaris sp.]
MILTTISLLMFLLIHGILKAVQDVLHDEITHTVISQMTIVVKSSIINGPCIITDDVIIDDFCKIIGPLYVGSGSFIGMSSLIRKSMMGINTRIGFNSEVAKTYFEGHDRIAHQNGYTRTAHKDRYNGILSQILALQYDRNITYTTIYDTVYKTSIDPSLNPSPIRKSFTASR